MFSSIVVVHAVIFAVVATDLFEGSNVGIHGGGGGGDKGADFPIAGLTKRKY